jgi:hypothetical protein
MAFMTIFKVRAFCVPKPFQTVKHAITMRLAWRAKINLTLTLILLEENASVWMDGF